MSSRTAHERAPRLRRTLLLRFLAVALSLGMVAGVAEIGLRLAGHRPWRDQAHEVARRREPLVHAPDPELGWVLVPGHYTTPPYTPEPGAPDLVTTIWEGPRRATRPGQAKEGRHVAVVGGSYAYGWALTDSDTLPWLLQERLPDLAIDNLGVAAYGTLQSDLRLARALAADEAPGLVVYAFTGWHESRNVASAGWLRGLSEWARRGHVDTPYCELDAERELICAPPIAYPVLPGSSGSALVAFAQDRFATLAARERSGQEREVTAKLIHRMNARARATGSRLLVVLLHHRPAAADGWSQFAEASSLDWISCRDPRFGRADMQVPGDGHPNAAMNRAWLDCLAPAVRARLP